jgi:hypothetical protein
MACGIFERTLTTFIDDGEENYEPAVRLAADRDSKPVHSEHK